MYMAQQGMQWKHICSILQSPNALTLSQKVHQLNRGLPHTCFTSGDSAKHFLNNPIHGSTRHAVQTHLLYSAVTLCILWHLTVSQKLHQLNSGVPHTCLTSGDSAKHFSNHPYPPYICVNKACNGSAFTPSAVILCIL